jgi:hypothetical protein
MNPAYGVTVYVQTCHIQEIFVCKVLLGKFMRPLLEL